MFAKPPYTRWRVLLCCMWFPVVGWAYCCVKCMIPELLICSLCEFEFGKKSRTGQFHWTNKPAPPRSESPLWWFDGSSWVWSTSYFPRGSSRIVPTCGQSWWLNQTINQPLTLFILSIIFTGFAADNASNPMQQIFCCKKRLQYIYGEFHFRKSKNSTIEIKMGHWIFISFVVCSTN